MRSWQGRVFCSGLGKVIKASKVTNVIVVASIPRGILGKGRMDKPYYQDEWVTIYHGDCREILPKLPKVDLVLTDPPYGEGFGFLGDTTPAAAAELLGEALSVVRTEPGAYLACFWTMRSLDILFDEVREQGWSYLRLLAMHVNGKARPYLAWLPRLQPIVLFRKGSRSSKLHDHFAPYLADAIKRSGMNNAEVASLLGCDSRLVMKWSRFRDPSWCLPTERFYPRLKVILGLSDEFDTALTTRQRERAFRPDSYHHDLYRVVDGKRQTLHPTEKPLSVVSSLCSGLPSTSILDPFLGSGTTAVAAKNLSRRCIGIEIEEKYCEIAANRCSQQVMDLSKYSL